MVQTVNIGNWGFGLPYYFAEQPLDLDAEEVGLVSKAVCLAGLQHLEEDILSKVSTPLARNPPLVALLVACLPNVSTIYAHIPDADPYLHSVLLAASERPCTMLTNLKTIYLLPEVPILEPDAPEFKSNSAYYPALSLDVAWPALYLPSLRALYLYNLETQGLADLLASQNPKHGRECLITRLSIATHKDSKCLPEDISALLALPKALTSVSLFWNNYKFKTGPAKKDVMYKVSNNQVWRALQQHSSSLESIDVFHGISTGHHNIMDHFGPLTLFKAMRSLTVQAEVLLGWDDSNLLTCLPPGVRTLTLIVDTVRRARLPGLFCQLGLLVQSGKPPVKRLRLCENNPKYMPGQRESDILEAYQNLLSVCAQHNVSFGVVGYWSPGATDCPIASGGRCPWIWRKTMHMMGTGIHRREKVRTRLVRREFGESSSSGGEDETGFAYGVHTVPFTDHRGRASFMVFEARDPPKLPPLISCSFYFTHPDTEPGSLDLAGLFRAIENQKDDFHVRLDIYFLPSASETDCTAHYRAERATRADSRVQMQESRQRRRAESIPPPLPRPLPGMIQRLQGREGYEGALCICADPNWNKNSSNGNPQQTFSCVQFWARDKVEETGLPSRFTEVFPLAGNTESAVSGWVWNLAHGFLDEFLGPYQKAERKGWGYW
ncbi:hypothetical protein BJX68DRAFT_272163 [Aspergillus pseudodeflectus]|uniref:Uncharacterized protein n=1 Tax=Aspergillus pseudodeflectus TaxID=176178 RepID=A0ABR4JGX2_9EURO